ncbi:MAG: hypothetical protein ONB46_01985 [candidate division KSB1 bacterium]|nr:hypothetical protein [candidate division KSB1 bacterium]MDZ7364438.1 hypothetical protein [candidate division KSB1 bacterium]MDZ7402810.1 hypothetical protein [candidate division KSB1 bacterium]
MRTTEASSSHFGEKASRPASSSAKPNKAEEKIRILPQKRHLFTLPAAKAYFAGLWVGRPI